MPVELEENDPPERLWIPILSMSVELEENDPSDRLRVAVASIHHGEETAGHSHHHRDEKYQKMGH
jgi:mannose-6-phosphate isomerase-like protein (cupin superfamily)